MADFPLIHFPFKFECPDCPHGSTTEVTREDVSDLPPKAAGPTVRETVNEVLRPKGWWEVNGQKRCPKCVEDLVATQSQSADTPAQSL
jgi:hypothetical protein